MGLDIRDVEIIVQHRIERSTTAADIWQRLGRCVRDNSMRGLGVVLVDDSDRLLLDPSSAIVAGFDYRMPLTPETVGE